MKKKSILGVLFIVLLVMLAASACGRSGTENPGQDSTLKEVQQSGQESTVTKEKTNSPSSSTPVKTAPVKPVKKEGASQTKEDPVQSGKTGQKTASLPQAQEPEQNNFVTLKVTRDFGSQIIFNKKVEIQKDWTILDLLEDNLDLETDWDGGFIKGINGLISDKGGLSGKRTDWFYYVNGICADVGADGYRLHSGETVWWDYHLWQSMGLAISAVIGSYPEPFLHGYNGKVGGTSIMCTSGKKDLGEKLKKALVAKKVKTVNLCEMDEAKIKKRTGPLIVVGEWPELNKISWLQDFNKAYRKTGAGVHFTDQGVELIKYSGEVDRTVSGSAGVIIAAGSGLADEASLWLISGTDEKGLEQAVHLLVKNPEKISGKYGAALVSGKVVPLPIQ